MVMSTSSSNFLSARRLSTVVLGAALAWLALTSSSDVTNTVHAQSSCGPLINPIVCENQKAGAPDTEWDVSGAGDPTIQGFATSISVTPGQTQTFKIDTSSSNYTINIYRLGYYGGSGAHKVTVTPITPLVQPQNQPNCMTAGGTGLIDCGNWAVSANWAVPADAVSGIYFALLHRVDTGGESHIPFIVRESDTASHHSDVVFQTSDTTWQAYNQYGGNSLYVGGPGTNPGRAYKVSYNRPFTTRGTTPEDFLFNAEYPMVRWLESNGYDVSYISGVDTDRSGPAILTPSKHKMFMSVGHDEYWSGPQRANVEAARAAGLHMAFLSGNEVFWKTRWEASIDGTNTPYRTLVSYKETHANGVIDPADPPTWTGTWRDPRFSPPADGGRPENGLTGTLFKVNSGTPNGAITVPAAYGQMRFWRNTSVATLPPGGSATLTTGTLGYEWDEELNNGFRPAGLVRLSSTTLSGAQILLDYGSSYGSGSATHNLTLYRHTSGALVFGAGTVQWSWGLDANHDRGSAAADVRMRQAMVNLLADMGVQPATLQSGLVLASASTDTLAPTSSISSPAAGASIAAGTVITISGTASDAGGGTVTWVEVSTDNGATWNQATGTTAWTYAWTVSGSGSKTIKSRAFDDNLNVEIPSAGVTINVTGGTCCSIWSATTVPPVPLDDGDTSSVELGTKFRADADGYVTGVRFYKGSANTGTHTGSLWTSTGTLLGTVTFAGETASGWQQANFAAGIPITANTTYIVSYHAPVGHYTGTDPFFTAPVDNPPLHALQNGIDGPNGVYAYGSSSAFPTNTFNSENYWADVVFNQTPVVDTTPPTVIARFPATGATGVDPTAAITVTFSEKMNPSTISSSTVGSEGGTTAGTFELRDPSNNLVPASVSYDSTSKIATLTPSSVLGLSTTYTVLVKGGSVDPRVKDLAGNAMAANVSWSFTTAATLPPPISCPCSIWLSSTVPNPVDDGDTASVVVGTRFRSDVPGYITGARFYKAALNTGTHVATLWTNTGTQLATTTFSGETASGWQQASFATPVPIAANTTYLISYLAPKGHYSAPDNYFTAAAIDNPPLHGLKDGTDGANGVYSYSTTSIFPTQTYRSEAYFVDAVFNTTSGPDIAPPAVKSVSPAAGASGVFTNTNVIVTFNEAVNPTTINTSTILLRDSSNTVVPATVTYDQNLKAATLTPASTLPYTSVYTGVVKAGIKDLAGNATTTDYTWSFTTSSPPPPPPTQGPGGPVLVVTSSSNPFSTYYLEILRTEGVNAFAAADLSTVTSTTLSAYDVVVLGETPLSSAQVTMFTNWVNGGGNLIAMRPDKQLAGLLGLTDAAATLSNAYLLVTTTAGTPGAGIVNQTIQFHGTADKYTLNGATSLATLYSNATTATANPAVTSRTVGAGHAVAFTYDLAKSIVYTRQGNPAWSGQERDGQAPIRSDDLFFGAKAGDIQPDWVDFNKVAIPQADEQQRFLWNIVLNINKDKKPLPRFWYFPRMLPAVVVMTGDDHANAGTAGRFDGYIGFSNPGCNVANWDCIRGTSYIYPGTAVTDAQVASYVAQGFEIALHVTTNCGDWTPSTLASFYSTQLAQFNSSWPHAGQPTTNRTHCIVVSDYATQWQVELNNNIRLDTNFYYWPDTWILDRPGMFTGSGIPMRFATSTGQIIDVYQATTQMTDESGQTFPKNIDTLLDNAIGLGYYGAFTANMHTDYNNGSNSETWSTAIVNSAKARGIPVITSKQMLTWLDGRNGSTFQAMNWNGSVLSFNIAVGAGANGLQTLVPATAGTSPLTGITFNGTAIGYSLQAIKGVQYAIFAAGAGSYQVSYGPDIAPPTISGLSASSIGTSTATITWTTNEIADSVVHFGTDPASITQTTSNSALVTSHSIGLGGLTPNTTYYYRVTSTDAAGNPAISPATDPPASFATTGPFITGTITPASSGSGATVTLSGASGGTTTANGSGGYTFSGLGNGKYTVTPTKAGYTFVPPSQTMTLSGSGLSGVDFTAQPVTISGTVSPSAGGSGTTLTLTGSGNGAVTADSSGNFTFSGVADGTYTVTPTKGGYTFSPANRSLTISGGSASGVNFTALPVIITGTVSPAASGSGATVKLTGAATATTTADVNGVYTFSAVANGSYTVTPTKTGFTFTPTNRSVVISLGGSVTGADFSAQTVPTFSISGTITPAASGSGTTVALTGNASGTATADINGNYTLSGVPDGNYTVTPTKAGFTFTPPNRAVLISGANGTASFTAQAAPALSIDANVSTARSTSGTTIAAAVSTTATNELLLALIATDNVSGTTTITNVTATGLTWALVRRTNTQRGTAEIWRAFATTTLSNVTVTATISQSLPASITVLSFKGVDTSGTNGSGAIGATGSGNAASGPPTATLTTTRAGSLVVGVGNDWDNAIARTLGPNQTLVQQYLATDGDTFWVQRTTNAVPAAGSSITINDTAPTADQYNLTICEILAAP